MVNFSWWSLYNCKRGQACGSIDSAGFAARRFPQLALCRSSPSWLKPRRMCAPEPAADRRHAAKQKYRNTKCTKLRSATELGQLATTRRREKCRAPVTESGATPQWDAPTARIADGLRWVGRGDGMKRQARQALLSNALGLECDAAHRPNALSGVGGASRQSCSVGPLPPRGL